MAQGVADTEMIRRQNRQLVLDALRRAGPLSRSQIAAATGLSNASLTAIAADLAAEGIIAELAEPAAAGKGRGRPAVSMTHDRSAGFVLLFEVDVNRCRISLLNYAGVLVDRMEADMAPTRFAETRPTDFFIARIESMMARNPESRHAIHAVSISVQGILDVAGSGLRWSPIANLAGHDVVGAIRDTFNIEAEFYKRGRLMADGMRWLDPDLSHSSFATVYLGSTIGMGVHLPSGREADPDLGTEFGHMIHVPDGALCRCGARGCIEAYASDYAILRNAYSVPERTAPANTVPFADFQQLMARAHRAERTALRAFTIAGQAIGAGIGRLISIVEIKRLVLIGPTTAAYELLRPGMEDAIQTSLMGRMRGLPPVQLVTDAGEPIYRGLKMKTLTALDRTFAHRVATTGKRRTVG